jgi:hypothetical protein
MRERAVLHSILSGLSSERICHSLANFPGDSVIGFVTLVEHGEVLKCHTSESAFRTADVFVYLESQFESRLLFKYWSFSL